MSKPQYEKMSKSRGNVITPDEVVFGVVGTPSSEYEFRLYNDRVLDQEDIKQFGVWQDRGDTGMFFTSTKTGKLPVYLCRTSEDGCCNLLIDGKEIVQHPRGYVEFYGYAKVGECDA